MTRPQVVARVREILAERIRLVPRPDYETSETWMVKPGCLDQIAEEIAVLMGKPMSEMVERVAKAIQDELGSFSEPKLATYMDAARAAIAAMREPTDEMYNGVNKLDKMWRDSNSFEIWRAMIDGILAADASRETIR